MTRYGPAVYFPGSSGDGVETADDNPTSFASGDALYPALLIRWVESLPFLDAYRTMCMAPQPGFQRLLQSIEHLVIAA